MTDARWRRKAATGSTFYFELPFGVPAEADKALVTPKVNEEPETTPDVSVLIAEDNRVNQRVLEAYFVPFEFNVTVAVNGAEALAAIQEEQLDIIFMDIQMPVMDGIDAT